MAESEEPVSKLAESEEPASPAQEILMQGYLIKQGGNIRNWKERWCVLHDDALRYYTKEGETKQKNFINLSKGRGVREKKHCNIDEDWPGDAKHCFGVAVEGRTWYFHGKSAEEVEDWKSQIQACIEKHGNPNSDWKNDTVGQPVNPIVKVVQSISLKLAKTARSQVHIDTGNEHLNAAGSVAAKVGEDQLAADPHATPQERLKMAGSSALEGVQENVDNDVVKVAAGVAKDQLDADSDLTPQQRLALAAGSTLEGIGDVTDNEAIGIAGGVVKDQATADPDCNLKQRAAIAVGSTAAGFQDATDNDAAKAVAKGVEKVAKKAEEKFADKEEEDDDGSNK